ncbi:MAG: GC-type dockerin domain-anchored protein [Phycisphaerales bacterium]
MARPGTALPALALFAAAGSTAAAVPPTWTPFPAGPNAPVNALVVHYAWPNKQLFLGGEFTAAGAVPSSHIAAWNGAGFDPVPSLHSPVVALAERLVNCMPTVVAGGFLGLVDDPSVGVNGTNLVTLGESGWSKVTPPCQLPWVGGLGVYNNELIASGGGMNYISRFDGVQWSEMGQGLITVARDMLTLDEPTGPVLVASAGSAGSQTLGMIAKWDGTHWTNLTDSFSGINGLVDATCIFDDGSGSGPALFIGGGFIGFTNSRLNHVAKYVGGVWQPLGLGVNGDVHDMAVFDDGEGDGPALYVAGNFTTAGGQPASRIARWKNGQWSPLGAGVSGGAVLAIEVFDDDGDGPIPAALYAAGAFTSAGGQPSLRLARWGPPAPCKADVASLGGAADDDGVLTADDVVFYLQSFFAANLVVADIASLGGGSTPDGQLTPDDLVAYLAAFFSGCP